MKRSPVLIPTKCKNQLFFTYYGTMSCFTVFVLLTYNQD